ncbi:MULTISPECIES: histidinol-phosphate transaminase [unclassified Carboxydocella]|uniref:histidinol-phosphate transaminase n=1 Tax=unclassified Carboxydocella TaxID=2685367 RepID=UPI0009C7BD53|nr:MULTISPECIES: histidinol-phosphate transaminase [unclassified Carboxydocella]GAW29119.1 histidinol-phosphate transaminase [Carboxydocella sp. ULO1]GAW31997.1 histidinol-phosphate transaminase [Carboxydocella sp. JDF658]
MIEARAWLQALKPYDPHELPWRVKLDANENPHPFPAPVLAEMLATLSTGLFQRYPDATASQLRVELAAYCGVEADQILLGNGSDEILHLVCQAYVGPGRQAVYGGPSFAMYAINTLATGGTPVEVPLDEEFNLELAPLLEQAQQPATGAVFICTPNNPTGNLVERDEIIQVLERTEALVVVDEAYYEFCGQTVVDLLPRYPQLLILRTFSKAFGLAGLRVGYALGNRELIRELHKVRQPYNLNAFSQLAALTALRHRELFVQQIETILKDKEELSRELAEIAGVKKVWPSAANFLLVEFDRPAQAVAAALAERGILVRFLGHPRLTNCLRITVGTMEENRLLMANVKEVLAK